MPKYKVTLTDEERQYLHKLIQKGGKGYRIRHAQILLKLDQIPENVEWTYNRIQEAYGATHMTIAGVAQRFVFEGVEAALGRKKQENYHRKITGDIEARICAIACTEAPEGRSRWTMQLIADELIRLEIVDYVSDSTICEVLKKNEIKPWLVKEWCIPEASAEFVAKMEDVLDVYQRPYDPLNPVVCIDETNKQLIIETRIPCEPGQPEKVDSEYERNGVADVFMIVEPLAGKRETIVTETRNSIDFANVLKHTSDVMYPSAEKIVLVTDNLNTHNTASLYKAFSPEEAHRLANRFEWHFTPNHGSWLDVAEIEIGVMCRQALAKPLPDMDSFKQQIKAWTVKRNEECKKVNWQFTAKNARIKLKRLYPTIAL
jgi:hypothetical protein